MVSDSSIVIVHTTPPTALFISIKISILKISSTNYDCINILIETNCWWSASIILWIIIVLILKYSMVIIYYETKFYSKV